MDEALGYYQQQAQALRSDYQPLAQLQKAGLTWLMQKGFPTRADEDWKYSAPDRLLKERFSPASLAPTLSPPTSREITILPLAKAMEQLPELMQRCFSQASPIEHGFHALNAALLQNGMVIYVPKNIKVAEPLTLTHWQDQANQAVFLHHVVILEAGASLTLIQTYEGKAECTYLTSGITTVLLEKGASLSHTLIQRESKAAYHLSHLFAHQAADSRLESHVMNLGGKWVRSDQSLYLEGEGASCLMNGVYGLGEGQHMDHHTAVFHEVGGCQSEQDYKGVIVGKSRAVFNGRVVVKKGAQKSLAKQQNKNLLLSTDAEIDTKPQLEIDANDVMCSHGATVGQLDENLLFYFESRGLSRAEATRFMVDGFTAENIQKIGQPALCEQVSVCLHEQLLGRQTHAG